jgi:membrane-associated phospholipid phosphatase
MILGMIGLKLWRRVVSQLARVLYVVLAVAFVVVVRISRVALSSHFPSDMLAGIFGGFAARAVRLVLRQGGWADKPSDLSANDNRPSQARRVSPAPQLASTPAPRRNPARSAGSTKHPGTTEPTPRPRSGPVARC